MELPKEKLEIDKKDAKIILIVSPIILFLCFLIIDFPLLYKRIIFGGILFLIFASIIISFLWDLVLPTKARKERVASQIKQLFLWLQNYGYSFKELVFLPKQNFQLIYSGNNLPQISLFWNQKEKQMYFTMWAKIDDRTEWWHIGTIGKEWFGLDADSKELSGISYYDYCDKLFPMLGINKLED